jgi:hypothetical protein
MVQDGNDLEALYHLDSGATNGEFGPMVAARTQHGGAGVHRTNRNARWNLNAVRAEAAGYFFFFAGFFAAGGGLAAGG